ncbi:MAG: acyl dehydratase [Alphaproteobacteria bacterium]|nr:acyl dehydratase [Alphaproteobacteria bacterium]
MMPIERFDTLPNPPLVKALLARGGRLDLSQPLPDLEVQVPGVDAGDVEAYGRLCGFPSVDPLPTTWPQVRAVGLHAHVFMHKTTPVSAMGMVHVYSRIEQHAPISRNARMDLRCHWGEARGATQGAELDLLTAAEVNGELAWRSVTTVLCRGAGKDKDAPKRGDGPKLERVTRSTSWRLSEDLGRRYARVAGDMNPIHQYAWSAKLFGFKRHIIHGMWSLARGLAELDDAPKGPRVVECTFRRPVFLPSTVVFESGPIENGVRFRLLDRDAKKVHLWGEVRGL